MNRQCKRVTVILAVVFLVVIWAAGSRAAEMVEIFPQLGHAGRVQSVTYSPDGKYILSGSTDNTIRLWDIHANREIRRFSGHTDGVRSAVFSPNGNQVLSGGHDKTLRLWDVNTGKEIRRFVGHTDTVLWSVFSPDGKQALSCGADKTLRLWNINSGRTIRVFTGHTDEVYDTAFSPDGRLALSGSTDKTMRLWDVSTGKEIRKFSGHTKGVFAVAFSPDGRLALSGSEDHFIRLWDVASGKELRHFDHKDAVYTISFSPDGKTALSGGFGGINLWDIKSGEKIRSFAGDNLAVYYSVAFSPDGRYTVSGGLEKNVLIWDVLSGKEIRSLGQPNWISSIAISPDGKFVLTGNSDKTICLWDTISGKRLRTFSGHADGVCSVTFSPDNRFALSGSDDKTIRLWDVGTGEEIRRFDEKNRTSSVVFSPDGKAVLSSGEFHVLNLWDLISGRKIQSFKFDFILANSVAFSPDGKFALSDSADCVSLWDVATGNEIRKFSGFTHFVQPAVFSPDWKYVLAGGSDEMEGTPNGYVGVMRLWDAATGKEVRKFSGHTWPVFSVAYSPDGCFVLSGSQDKTMRLWDAVTGQELRRFTGHSAGVTAVAFFPDGRFAVSGSEDGTARVWDIHTGKELVQFIGFSGGEWVSITPEGFYNASENGDRYLNVRIGNNVYGIDQYREKFYRPDIVKLALSGKRIEGLDNIANIKQAPRVAIVNVPATVSKNETQVVLRITDNGGGIGDIRLYLNGSVVVLDNARGLTVAARDDGRSMLRSYLVKLVKGANTIRAIAFNAENSMQSTDAVLDVIASFNVIRKPTLHALVIGINEYKNPKLTLQYAVADAKLFADTLKKSASGLFENISIKILTTRETTSAASIANELRAMRDLNPDDLFVLYVASHGVVDDGEYYLITSNVGLTRTEKLRTDALAQTALKELIANIPTTKKLIVLDTCNAGAAGDAIQVAMLTRGMSEDTAMKILSRAVGSTILSAATSSQEALEGYQGHGLFTWVLSEGLGGKADKAGSGFIKTTDIADYVGEEVPNLAERVFKRAQYPTISMSGQPFPIGKVQ